MLQPLPAVVEVIVAWREFLPQALERRIDHRFPGIVFLAANEVPGAEAAVIGRAAVLEVMHVIGDQMGVDPGFTHHLGKRVVERLERSPAAMHEVQASGMQIAARGHAGQAADEMRVEGDRAAGEAVEVGRSNALRAIAADRAAHQRVEQDENRAHGSIPGSVAMSLACQPGGVMRIGAGRRVKN